MIQPGSRVRLVVPENPILHGQTAEVASLTPWGAHVRTRHGTGQFRALHSEMEPLGLNGHARAETTGDSCRDCGGVDMVRTGTCSTCQTCGSTSGCS